MSTVYLFLTVIFAKPKKMCGIGLIALAYRDEATYSEPEDLNEAASASCIH